jgi:hypothetical protein
MKEILPRYIPRYSRALLVALPLVVCSQNTLLAQGLEDKGASVYEDCPVGVSARIDPSAACLSASFINPKGVEVFNETRKFWRTVEFYNIDRRDILSQKRREIVVCSDYPLERSISLVEVVNYRSGGRTTSRIQSPTSVPPEKQTDEQKSVIRFVCNIR